MAFLRTCYDLRVFSRWFLFSFLSWHCDLFRRKKQPCSFFGTSGSPVLWGHLEAYKHCDTGQLGLQHYQPQSDQRGPCMQCGFAGPRDGARFCHNFTIQTLYRVYFRNFLLPYFWTTMEPKLQVRGDCSFWSNQGFMMRTWKELLKLKK